MTDPAHPHSPWPALLYLWRRSLWNGWRSRVGRLRQPRYAVAFVLGLAYVVLNLYSFAFDSGHNGHGGAGTVKDAAPVLLPLAVAALAPVWWITSRSHMVLAFKPPEVQFLFQGPIARRTLLNYRLLRAQAGILLLALLFALLLRPLVSLPWPLAAASVWLVMATMHLHQVAAGLVRASWTHHGRAGFRRHWLPLAIIIGAGLVLLVTLVQTVPTLAAAQTGDQFFAAVNAALSRPLAALVLLPFTVLVAPLLAHGAAGWAVGMLGTLCLWVLHYLWVIHTDTAFEETAARAGVELQQITSAFREGRGFAARLRSRGRINAPWFRLKPVGRPTVAVFWKGLTAFTRTLSAGRITILVLVIVGFRLLLSFIADTPEQAMQIGAMMPITFAVMAVVMGPLILRNDLRTDFQRQELMRTYPLAGREVAAAEIGASATSLLLVVAFFLTTAAAFLILPDPVLPRPWMPPAAWAAALLLAAPICLLAMCVQNAIVALYPGWTHLGPSQRPGLDQLGGMMLMMLISGLLLVVGLLPPLLVGAVVAFPLYLVLGVWTAVPAALAAWLALIGECVGVVVLIGRVYDRMDPSEAGLLA